MILRGSLTRRVFNFNFDARTSRGRMSDKTSWFVKVWDERFPETVGIGECGPLPGLSRDALPDYETVLSEVIGRLPQMSDPFAFPNPSLSKIIPPGFPSITFGLETALLDLCHGGRRIIFENEFVRGTPIPINGLIWMGDKAFMLKQIDEKIARGFDCIKLKVGGLDFEAECDVLAYIRKKYSDSDLTLRLDANGAFVEDTMLRLRALAEFDIHSIEQPIPPGRPEMAALCRESPIPIALDEELIGVETVEAKVTLLKTLRPRFVVLKPTLHGGLSGTDDWIKISTLFGADWWITSALESNIGLNAICQFAAQHHLSMPQGLGTGSIYANNFESPLTVRHGKIFTDVQQMWSIPEFGA